MFLTIKLLKQNTFYIFRFDSGILLPLPVKFKKNIENL